jgi:hypothetical protein
MIKVVAETVEELQSLHRLYPDHTTISLPSRGKEAYKSKSLPQLWIDADQRDLLMIVESTEVDENYLRMVTWLLREDFFNTKCAQYRDEVSDRFFATEIRGNLIRLLRMGSWVDSPSSLGLEKLNKRLEKIDLGRRSDLNFSSQQSAIQKYDQDFTRDEDFKPRPHAEVEEPVDEGPDWKAMYRDGSKATREDILSTRPWMRSSLVDQYGEP